MPKPPSMHLHLARLSGVGVRLLCRCLKAQARIQRSTRRTKYVIVMLGSFVWCLKFRSGAPGIAAVGWIVAAASIEAMPGPVFQELLEFVVRALGGVRSLSFF